MKKIVVAAVSLLLCGLAPAAVAAPPAVTWEPCQDEVLRDAGAECGFVDVPLDHSRPSGEKIQLAISRVRHTARYQGIMLVNPGGPGVPGLRMSTLGSRVPGGAGGFYDWIGFDPRGVGSSRPALSCDPQHFTYGRPPYVPLSRQVEQANLNRAKAYAHKCGKAGGKLLDHLSTADTARDMDLIRRALGERKLNYYGYSYGTYLGQVYASLYGRNLRRAVWDSVVDHQDVWYRANLEQDVAFDRNMKIYFGWIAEHSDVYRLGVTREDVEARYYAERFRLEREPAGGLIGAAEFTDLFVPAGYSQRTWAVIAAAFSSWVHRGNWQILKERYDLAVGPGDDNGYANYLGVLCTDAPWPADWNTWRADNWATHFRAPFSTWANAWYNAPCRDWPAVAKQPVLVTGRDAPPVLIVNEELDAGTPYEGALQARRTFTAARLISTPGGTTHSNSLRGNACVDDLIAAYLSTGALPERVPGNRSDVQCQPLPRPQPMP